MILEFDEECGECKGTGIYVGMAERDGVGVVCHRCKGTGKAHFKHEFTEFSGRKTRLDVDRVIQANPGIMCGSISGDTSWCGGITYDEWLAGVGFGDGTEMRKSTCPAWWYQLVDYDKKPRWNECGWGRFSDCKHFENKEKCWERFDAEVSK